LPLHMGKIALITVSVDCFVIAIHNLQKNQEETYFDCPYC
jgi:hypothetical protein